MTRLKTEWIKNIEHDVKSWDQVLLQRTGADLCRLALRGSGTDRETFERAKSHCKVGVVSITSGQGVIGSFAQSVGAIISAMGFAVEVAEKTDVEGFYQLRTQGADVIFMADDNRFVAVNLGRNALGENDRSTARGYVEALEGLMAKKSRGSLRGQRVLLLGYGRLGKEIQAYLLEKGATPVIYDRDEDIRRQVKAQGKAVIDKTEDIRAFDLILDATSTGPWITGDMLHEDVLIAAPGIPFSLDQEAKEKLEGRWIHDNLPIGTAVMLAFALGEENGK